MAERKQTKNSTRLSGAPSTENLEISVGAEEENSPSENALLEDQMALPLFDAQSMQRPSKDEMNLILHPFGSLSKERDFRVIELNWETQHPISKKNLRASWKVSGHPQLGLPTANDERVYLVAIELTRESSWSKVVHFTRAEMLRRLGWPDNAAYYRILFEALERLSAVRITAKNAFYEPASRYYINGSFGLLETFLIAGEGPGKPEDEKDAPTTFFEWNSVVHKSFLAGNIRTLNLGYALSLKLPIAFRLFRYLDMKRFDGKARFEIGVRELCEKHLGAVVENRYDSQLKQTLAPAHAELIERGFLANAWFEKMKTRKGLKVIYEFATTGGMDSSATEQTQLLVSSPASDEQFQLFLPEGMPSVFGGIEIPEDEPEFEVSAELPLDEGEDESERLIALLVEQGVTSKTARELCKNFSFNEIEAQLEFLPFRGAKNKSATLVKSIREAWAAPQEVIIAREAQNREQNARMALEDAEAVKARQKAVERQETARLESEERQLEELWEKLDENTRTRIDQDIEGKLGILGNLGRGEAAKTAFRRTALRDLLKQMS